MFRRFTIPIRSRQIQRLAAAVSARSAPAPATDASSSDSADFAVVIPVHDSPQVTARCFDSVVRFGHGAEIVIVDDGSRQHATIELIDRYCRDHGWKLTRNAAPLGHSRASEQGVQQSSRPLICLLNSDAMLSSQSLGPIAQLFRRHPKVAVIGPSTSSAFGWQQIDEIVDQRFAWDADQIEAFAAGYTRLASSWLHRLFFSGTESRGGYVQGFAFCVRRRVWEQLSGFQPELVDYGNEEEFCLRVIKAGFEIVWTRRAYVHHLHGQSYNVVLGTEEVERRRQAAEKVITRFHEGYLPLGTPANAPVDRK